MTLTKDDLQAIGIVVSTLIDKRVRPIIKEEVQAIVKKEVRVIVKQEVKTIVKEEVRAIVKQEVRPIVKEEVQTIVKQEVPLIVKKEVQGLMSLQNKFISQHFADLKTVMENTYVSREEFEERYNGLQNEVDDLRKQVSELQRKIATS